MSEQNALTLGLRPRDPSVLLASERSERDTIRGVQIRAGAVSIYIYLITLIPRNITSQLQCISASAAGTSAIPVTDE